MSTSEIHPLLPTLSATVFIEIDKVIDKEKFIDYSASEIVHFVGYASGLSPHPAVTEFVERCEDKRYFAFDGDDLHVSSFTMQMVMHAALKLKNGVDINIIAFRNDREIDGLRASWHQKIIDINVADLSKSAIVSANPSIPLESTVMKLKMIVVMLPSALTPLDNDYYAYHGLTAMQTTQAATVLCMGGGLTVRRQFELCREKNPIDMSWFLFPHLRSKDGVNFEELGLQPFVGNGVLLIQR